jgi:hypothetical protein
MTARFMFALSLCVPCLTAALACSSSSGSGTPMGPDAGYCASNGYEPAGSGMTCPKGTCLAPNLPEACCGSVCPTCESKGLVSYDDAGNCPGNTYASCDPNQFMQCCDTTTCGPVHPDGGAD